MWHLEKLESIQLNEKSIHFYNCNILNFLVLIIWPLHSHTIRIIMNMSFFVKNVTRIESDIIFIYSWKLSDNVDRLPAFLNATFYSIQQQCDCIEFWVSEGKIQGININSTWPMKALRRNPDQKTTSIFFAYLYTWYFYRLLSHLYKIKSRWNTPYYLKHY